MSIIVYIRTLALVYLNAITRLQVYLLEEKEKRRYGKVNSIVL